MNLKHSSCYVYVTLIGYQGRHFITKSFKNIIIQSLPIHWICSEKIVSKQEQWFHLRHLEAQFQIRSKPSTLSSIYLVEIETVIVIAIRKGRKTKKRPGMVYYLKIASKISLWQLFSMYLSRLKCKTDVKQYWLHVHNFLCNFLSHTVFTRSDRLWWIAP